MVGKLVEEETEVDQHDVSINDVLHPKPLQPMNSSDSRRLSLSLSLSLSRSLPPFLFPVGAGRLLAKGTNAKTKTGRV